MATPDQFKQGAAAYRNGFLIGAFIGVIVCLILQKTIWSIPLLLGLVCGAIAINTKI